MAPALRVTFPCTPADPPAPTGLPPTPSARVRTDGHTAACRERALPGQGAALIRPAVPPAPPCPGRARVTAGRCGAAGRGRARSRASGGGPRCCSAPWRPARSPARSARRRLRPAPAPRGALGRTARRHPARSSSHTLRETGAAVPRGQGEATTLYAGARGRTPRCRLPSARPAGADASAVISASPALSPFSRLPPVHPERWTVSRDREIGSVCSRCEEQIKAVPSLAEQPGANLDHPPRPEPRGRQTAVRRQRGPVEGLDGGSRGAPCAAAVRDVRRKRLRP